MYGKRYIKMEDEYLSMKKRGLRRVDIQIREDEASWYRKAVQEEINKTVEKKTKSKLLLLTEV